MKTNTDNLGNSAIISPNFSVSKISQQPNTINEIMDNNKNMYATKALDYLVLDKKERKNYLSNNGFDSQRAWLDGFKPQSIQGDLISFNETTDLFGIERTRIFRLLNEGFFGETIKKGSKRKFKVSEINKILKREAYFVPVQSFYNLFKKEQWYMGKRHFYMTFKQYYEKGLDKKGKYINLLNAAKIVKRMKKRKSMIEGWSTLFTLNRESGLNLDEDAMYRELCKSLQISKVI